MMDAVTVINPYNFDMCAETLLLCSFMLCECLQQCFVQFKGLFNPLPHQDKRQANLTAFLIGFSHFVEIINIKIF